VFIPKLIEFYKAGKFPFDKLIKFYGFDQISTAFEDSANGSAIKPILKLA
jgi:aryl-alcohol dehydrogenase